MGDGCRRLGEPSRLLFLEFQKHWSLQLPQRTAYSFPMRPSPEQLAAEMANKVIIQPAISFGWNLFFERLFINRFQLTPTVHATRFAGDEPKLAKHQH